MDLCVANVDKNYDDSNGFFYIFYMRLAVCVSDHKYILFNVIYKIYICNAF
jgi:hypothetical protein